MGLSMAHNSPGGLSRSRRYQLIDQAADTDRPQPKMTLAVGGSLLKLQFAKIPTGPRRAARRGPITAFTAGSRGRLFELLGSINQAASPRLPLFITLTYPKIFPTDRATIKGHLDTWLKRLRRAHPTCAVIWKLEYQRRGAPHFHILLFNVVWLDRHWLARAWFQVVDSGDPLHLKAGTRVEFIRSWKGVMHYASKYVAKVVGLPDGCDPGRFWGVAGRGFLPIVLAVALISFQGFYQARRTILLYYKARRRAMLQRSGEGAVAVGVPPEGWHPRFRSGADGCKLFLPYKQLARLVRCFG